MNILRGWAARSYRRRLLDEDLAAVADAIGPRVLEVGAGRGGRRGAFRPSQTERWITLDADARRVPHVRGDLRALPFRDASFDTVVCIEVLEYVEQPLDALREAHRVLRPGGRAVLSTPFVHRWDAANDLWRFTPHGLRLVLERAGFTVESERAQGAALASAANVLGHAARTLFAARAAFPLRLVAAALVELLFRLDRATARSGDLAAFSTGYVVVARR